MEPDRLGPIIRPIFKSIKSLFKELMQSDVILSFRKGPSGKIDDIQSVLWDKAFGCRILIDNNCLFLLMDRNGGIFLSGKLLMLPQNNIEDLIKRGEVNDSILDAQKEIFNMIVGRINDVFMEKVGKDVHLIMEDLIVDAENISFLSTEHEYLTYTANVKMIGPVTFSMALIMNKELANLILKHIAVSKETDMQESKEKEGYIKESKEPIDEVNIIKAYNEHKNNSSFQMEYIMEEDFPVAQIGTSLWNALNKMKEYEMDYIILVDGLRFIGLLTMADIRRGISPFIEEPFKDYCREQDLATKSFNIEWFLEREITPVPYNASLEEVIQIYLDQNTPYLPVCKNNRIIGVITHKKLVEFLAGFLFESVSTNKDEFFLRNELITDRISKVPSNHTRAHI